MDPFIVSRLLGVPSVIAVLLVSRRRREFKLIASSTLIVRLDIVPTSVRYRDCRL